MTLIVSGTNRPDSNSLKVSKYYQKILAQKGEKTDILSLSNLPQDLISGGYYGKTLSDFETIQNQVTKANKFIFIVPEYNGSFPGILKLFIDACKFPVSFTDKKAALVGHSTGKYGNIRGIEHLTGVCNYVGLHVLPLKLHIPNISSEINEDGDFFKDDTLKFTEMQMDKFLGF